MNEYLLEVKDLHVSFFTPAGEVKAVGGIDYELKHGEVMGIVGESGSGKSVEAYSIIGLLQSPGKVTGGTITFNGEDVLSKNKDEMTAFRGSKVAMIFQNPMTCLNPVYTIGNQLMEALRAHRKDIKKDAAAKRAIEMLELVGINNADKRMKQYPHELSGGMRQRVMIAMGLICDPELLIADEPTTALDVTIQAQILELMKALQKKTKMGIVFITHNLGVVAEICDRVSVMYAGKIVEQGPVNDIFYKPAHPYTLGLLRSMPR
ncbi:MAG: ABC transporter ATP-binding protein, partial [Oscillospiraceae bacterium]